MMVTFNCVKSEDLNTFEINVGWSDSPLGSITICSDNRAVLELQSSVRYNLFHFASFSEAKDFALKNFVSLESSVRGLTQKRLLSFSEDKIPCLAYHDSKYNFKRTKGGWFIQNFDDHLQLEGTVGSISRGKYGARYWLWLGGLIVYSDQDLSKVKKVAIELLNGKKDIYDTMYAWQSNYYRVCCSVLERKE